MSFENTVGKGEIARKELFLLFPQCFLSFRSTFYHFYQLYNCRLQTLSVWNSLKFVVWERVKYKKKMFNKEQTFIFNNCLFHNTIYFHDNLLVKNSNVPFL